MCTAAYYQNNFFGRNLDYEISYGEQVTITPRNFPFEFRNVGTISSHFAIIGMAMVAPDPNGHDYPLYYDAINEHGLGIAGLNFVGNTKYFPVTEGKDNIAGFEFIPWILGQCRTVAEAHALLNKMNFCDTAFSAQFPPSELHWMIADKESCIVVESVADGIKIYDNPTGVMTNNPPFPEQLFRLNDYLHLSAATPANTFDPNLNLQAYSRGMGGLGLPGDLSSGSRFVKVCWTRANSRIDNATTPLTQFFHILHSVDQQYGCCDLGDGKYEHTLYSSCCDLSQGIYYYTTYNNHQITAVSLHKENLDGTDLAHYPIINSEQIAAQN